MAFDTLARILLNYLWHLDPPFKHTESTREIVNSLLHIDVVLDDACDDFFHRQYAKRDSP